MTLKETPLEDRYKQLDRMITAHVQQRAERRHDGTSVAAISASDRFAWAKKAAIPMEMVERRIEEVCQELPAEQEKHWAIPRYRLKVNLPGPTNSDSK